MPTEKTLWNAMYLRRERLECTSAYAKTYLCIGIINDQTSICLDFNNKIVRKSDAMIDLETNCDCINFACKFDKK